MKSWAAKKTGETKAINDKMTIVFYEKHRWGLMKPRAWWWKKSVKGSC